MPGDLHASHPTPDVLRCTQMSELARSVIRNQEVSRIPRFLGGLLGPLPEE